MARELARELARERAREPASEPGKPKTPLLTADPVIFDRAGRLLLVRRKNPPFAGWYSLPGGFVETGETVEAAARRELAEETGLRIGRLALVGVYSDPARDPRGHNVSVAFVGRARSTKVQAGSDAAAAEWLADWRKAALAFDHQKIARDAAGIVGA